MRLRRGRAQLPRPAIQCVVANALLERGWHVQAIRPPTVPVGAARLRLTLSADHTPAQIDGLVDALRDLLGSTHHAFTAVPP